MKNAISKAGYTDQIVIGMDVAASEFYKDGKYDLDFKSPDDPKRYITPDKLADLYKSFVKDYPGWPIQLISSTKCYRLKLFPSEISLSKLCFGVSVALLANTLLSYPCV